MKILDKFRKKKQTKPKQTKPERTLTPAEKRFNSLTKEEKRLVMVLRSAAKTDMQLKNRGFEKPYETVQSIIHKGIKIKISEYQVGVGHTEVDYHRYILEEV